ncbi:MAG: metallophosphoesterase, partial [Deltaproteobacteria bacterium]|nr:metallophosphoesterase [Deltaproteobacteria bacterium]
MRTLWCLLLMAGCAGSTGGNMDGVDAAVADVRGEARDGAPEEELGAGADLPPPVEYRPVVFAVVTDIHLGGGYETPQTQNVLALFEEAAAMSPAPELLVVTGDLVDAVPEPVDTGAGGRVDALRRLFREGPLPVEAVAGNHDYYSAEFPVLTLTGDRAARDAMWDAELAMPRWQVTEHGGTRFIYVNTMQGDLWDISKGLNGSAGREQLEWLDGLLSEDRPAVLFMHHPPSTVLEAGDLTVEAVIAAHPDTVLAVFAGHLHMWARSEYEGVPIYLTEAGWDGEGIHHVRVDPEAR